MKITSHDQKAFSFMSILRPVFVLFSLYLLGDAFYRWDGVSYYATFSEFVPAVALAFILWSLMSFLTATLIWLSLRISASAHKLAKIKLPLESLLMFIGLLLLFGMAVLLGKKIVWPDQHVTLKLKVFTFIAVAIVAFVLSQKCYEMFRKWSQFIYDRLDPLVWLFGILFILSFPSVLYHAWIKDAGYETSNKIISTSSPDVNRLNIILLTFDALTTHDMSLYGYHRETTPFIKKWAQGASVFNRVKAASTHTTPATTSLITAKRLWTHQVYHQKSSINIENADNIALELKKNGYYTVMYCENSNASPKTLGISYSFDDITLVPEVREAFTNFNELLFKLFQGKILLYDWLLLEDFYPFVLLKEYIYFPVFVPIHDMFFTGEESSSGNELTLLNKFASDIDKNLPPEPFFAWIHLMPPHAPYLPPKRFQGVYNSSPELRTFREQLATMQKIEKNAEKGDLTPEELQIMEILRARYDEYILFIDNVFRDFIDSFNKMNISKKTVIILSSDHGESFEHNFLGHGRSLYEPVIHIPLIIKEPKQIKGTLFDNVVEQIDISSTILDLAGLKIPSWVEGRSLLPLLGGGQLPPKPAFSMYFEKSRSRGNKITNGFVSVYDGDDKLIYNIEDDVSLLFNLKNDPGEMNDMSNMKPDVRLRLLSLIHENLKIANEKIINMN